MPVPTANEFFQGFKLAVPTVSNPPTYASLQATRNALGAIASATKTTRGGGSHGYMGIVLPGPIYDLVAPGHPFLLPPNPGETPVIVGATAALISAAERQHREALRQWQEYNNLHEALKDKLEAAIAPIYLQSIRNRRSAFTQVTLREMFQHLFDTYSNLDSLQIHKNKMRLNEEWDPSGRLEDLISHLEDVQELSTDAHRPIPNSDLVDAGLHCVYGSGLYDVEYATWEARPTAEHTWPNFKSHFLQAQAILTRRQTRTASSAGYTANAATQELEDLVGRLVANNENHNTTARQDYAAFAATSQQSSITAQQRSEDAMAKMALQLQALQTEVGALRAARPPRAGRRPPADTRRRPAYRPHDSYCWSHGFEVGPTHNSSTCRQTLPGHKREATKDNMLGGSTLGQST
jgi:hypothetical protein